MTATFLPGTLMMALFRRVVRSDPPVTGRRAAPLRSRAQNVAAALTTTFSPTVIHEFRFNMLFMTIDLGTFLYGTNWNQLAGIRGFEQTANDPTRAGTFPNFNLSGYTAINTSGAYPPKTQNHLAHEFMDSLTWVKGNHIVKAGVKIPGVAGGTLATEPLPLDETLPRMRRVMERPHDDHPQNIPAPPRSRHEQT